jgi:para-nitrobenzyl esterase
MKRRDFVGYGAMAGAGLMLDRTVFAQSRRTPGATVKTSAGQVRGYVEDTVQIFKSVPYGASTAGAGRFLPPQKPVPWSGVRDAFEYEGRAPQVVGGEPQEMLYTDPREPQSEDCLRLHLWTPSTTGRRPVMVWLHGGGFFSGSGSYGIYSGKELARKHDVVSIALNHRLNAMGFLHLSHFGGRWANASNVGLLDVARALEWIKENVTSFGGDPANVTIFGQSGGAAKVSTLMAMPAARGLFHKAIAQSGSQLTAMPRDAAIANTEQLLKQLNISKDTLDRLQTVPLDEIIKAMTAMSGAAPAGRMFSPVIDGSSVPLSPWEPAAPKLSAAIPFMTGSTATEGTFFLPDAQLRPIDDAEFRKRVTGLLKVDGAGADRLIALYRKQQPGRENIDLYLRLESDASTFRTGVDTQAERKAMQGTPVYVYRFEYYSPVREGRLKAMHCMEIPFVFDNIEGGKGFAGSGAAAQRLADQMSAAWVAFARSGNPSHKGIPAWSQFTGGDRNTMVFGAGPDARLVKDPGSEERLALKAIRDAQARPTA